MIGHSVPMRRLMNLIDRTASSNLPAIITGETGTGKEVTAGRFTTGRLEKVRLSRSTAPQSPKVYSRVSCSATKKALSRVRTAAVWGTSNGPTAERSFSTRSRRCAAMRRPSSCE
jgi:transcriptional regulator with AAA-type ATPase domain